MAFPNGHGGSTDRDALAQSALADRNGGASARDPQLESALRRVSEADQRLLETADAAGQQAKSQFSSAVVAVGIGVALALLVGGATGRRRLGSSLLSLAVPLVLGAATKWLAQHRAEQERDEMLRWETEGGSPTAPGASGRAPH